VPPGSDAYFDRQVASVIRGVETGQIPRAQYGAVLIDEAHDFQPEWLKLVTGMVDPETDSLLLLYDDAQSIYKNHKLGFTLSSVGVQARGRTTILKLNYRNTRQILQLAYRFAQNAMKSQDTDEDGLPIIKPEAAGIEGLPPVLRSFSNKQQESEFIIRCVQKWHDGGKPWRDIGVVYRSQSTGIRLAKALENAGIPFLLTHDKASKASYSIEADRINLLTMHSSKGLEFPTVIVAGVGEKAFDKDEQENEVRLLYIAMTRAMEQLLITTCGKNAITEQLADLIVEVA
jgi:superfamily I DNA/RNA helicase